MKYKIYDLVKKLLEDYPELRDSDKKLIWEIWTTLGFVWGDVIDISQFMNAPSTETIRRCRQSIQEHNPDLRGSKWIQKVRAEKAEDKGTFIYKETVEHKAINQFVETIKEQQSLL